MFPGGHQDLIRLHTVGLEGYDAVAYYDADCVPCTAGLSHEAPPATCIATVACATSTHFKTVLVNCFPGIPGRCAAGPTVRSHRRDFQDLRL